MSLSEEIRKYVQTAYLEPAGRRGEDMIRIRAGDVHRDLHWVNRVPSVCTTLASQKFQRETGLHLVSKDGPPSGNSTTVVFTYRLPSQGETAKPLEERKSRLELLYGIASDVFRELGGGESFLRKERENLDFRGENDVVRDDEDQT